MTNNKPCFFLLICFSIFGFSCEKSIDIDENTTDLIDARDGDSYATVTIGTQIWMAENLRYNATGSYVNVNNPDPIYGRLYTWATLMDGSSSSASSPSGVQGVCPSGWHVPSDLEWNILEITLGMNAEDSSKTNFRGTHGVAMKSTTGWDNNGNGSNNTDFNIYPTGSIESGSNYSNLGVTSAFGTTTAYSPTHAWIRAIGNSQTGVQRITWYKDAGFPCRCVKDN